VIKLHKTINLLRWKTGKHHQRRKTILKDSYKTQSNFAFHLLPINANCLFQNQNNVSTILQSAPVKQEFYMTYQYFLYLFSIVTLGNKCASQSVLRKAIKYAKLCLNIWH
jgi:hypothetical protein